jgi:hypothetical protein
MALEVRSVVDDAMQERPVAPYMIDGRIVAGAVIAFDTPDMHMLEGRRDPRMLTPTRPRAGLTASRCVLR